MNRGALVAAIGAALPALLLAGATRASPALHAATAEETRRYPWLSRNEAVRGLADALPPPAGFHRVSLPGGSFGAWLRDLPLRGSGSVVRGFDGEIVHDASDTRVVAVASLDVGRGDLQQCADSIIRLHAEWLWSAGHRNEIAYHFTNGDLASWKRWTQGDRPIVNGSRVTWKTSASADDSRASFRRYLDTVFTYAGTLSLDARAARIARKDLQPGDFLVQGGSPGHAVLVLDVAEGPGGRRLALIGQGYSPAQDFHVVAAPTAGEAWFPLEADEVVTPFWRPFAWTCLRRLPEGRAETESPLRAPP